MFVTTSFLQSPVEEGIVFLKKTKETPKTSLSYFRQELLNIIKPP